jgi:hypothetical protein
MLHCTRGLCEPWCERYATTRHCARCVFLIVKGCEAGGAHVGVPAHGRTRKPGKSLDRGTVPAGGAGTKLPRPDPAQVESLE